VTDEKNWKNLFTFGECSTYLSRNIDHFAEKNGFIIAIKMSLSVFIAYCVGIETKGFLLNFNNMFFGHNIICFFSTFSNDFHFYSKLNFGKIKTSII
jgi:hypothetical protein